MNGPCEWNDCNGCEACPEGCPSCTRCQLICECYDHPEPEEGQADG
jgi:hypothetical protein